VAAWETPRSKSVARCSKPVAGRQDRRPKPLSQWNSNFAGEAAPRPAMETVFGECSAERCRDAKLSANRMFKGATNRVGRRSAGEEVVT
jgi:hypothetical protein